MILNSNFNFINCLRFVFYKNNLAQMYLNLRSENYWNWNQKRRNLENPKNLPMVVVFELSWTFLAKAPSKALEEIIVLRNVLQQNAHLRNLKKVKIFQKASFNLSHIALTYQSLCIYNRNEFPQSFKPVNHCI